MSGYSLRRLADAPHRLFFFLGAINLFAISLWWLSAMLLRHTQTGLHFIAQASSTQFHPLLMIYGFFPFFIFGFAFTAGPRWLQMPPVPRGAFFLPGAGMGVSFLLLFPAMMAGERVVAGVFAAYAVFSGRLWWHFGTLIARSRIPDKVHALLVQLCLTIGGITLLLAIAGIIFGFEWRNFVRSAGIWGFLVPLICTVCHRMLPFFTASALNSPRFSHPWRPWWLLAAMVSGAWLHGLVEFAGATNRLWMIDGPMAFICFTIVLRWGLMQSLRNRLLAMLHLSFLWLAIAYTLSFLQALFAHAGMAILGLGPLHAVSIGFLASITIAMVTRVTCGHSGRMLAADKLTWGLFLLFQSAAISRIAAESFPALYAVLIVLTSAIWFACLGIWTWRNAAIYLAPRTDGLPG